MYSLAFIIFLANTKLCLNQEVTNLRYKCYDRVQNEYNKLLILTPEDSNIIPFRNKCYYVANKWYNNELVDIPICKGIK